MAPQSRERVVSRSYSAIKDTTRSFQVSEDASCRDGGEAKGMNCGKCKNCLPPLIMSIGMACVPLLSRSSTRVVLMRIVVE